MYIVTGGAGFIGSNLTRRLLERGAENVVVVDDLQDGHKFRNIADLAIADYLDKDDFLKRVTGDANFVKNLKAILHQGACSATTEWDGRYMMHNNFSYSKALLHPCLEHNVPLIYASTAAVYGGAQQFAEHPANELPLNVYGYSKLLFDRYVLRLQLSPDQQVVGLRYFNVYGPREQHKGPMASVAWHFNRQLQEDGEVRLFEGCDGYDDGEQRRDFVYVDDVCDVNLWFLEHRDSSGVFNTGTGKAQSFNDIANAVIEWHGGGRIRYIPFPDHLKGAYQSFTEADLGELRKVGCDVSFRPVADGVRAYLDTLKS
ncbi:MAG: ADP-glyceromanno-heptose 6-epimerase [Woeseia sp.]|nr:ADP-glyceromanno-heptose 6-epimerase [Woeseia sp.]NNE61577.1 ADP-glyceromanno-heptose 6-epimerase [Woeseia sp.]NNL54015.1 ADP-glyceromanno-heptose 6-epimerase [Woeseia sp.]